MLVALLTVSLVWIHNSYESKKKEMSNDSKTLFENVRQTDNLQRQLKLLW